MKVTVRIPASGALDITVNASDTVLSLKEKIFGLKQLPTARQRLLFASKELIDTNTLLNSNVVDGAGIILVLRPDQSAVSSASSADIIDATKASQTELQVVILDTAVPKMAPSFPPEVEKCWSAAYVSDWDSTLKYLESNVSLEQLERRCKKSLVEFFAERKMIDALEYLVSKRGLLSPDELYLGLCASVAASSTSGIDWFVSKGATAELCQKNDRVQPLHLAVLYRKSELVKRLLAMGFYPNYACKHPNSFMEVAGATSFTPSAPGA
jgi:hypothetical protein